jgi:protein arginine kinase activator
MQLCENCKKNATSVQVTEVLTPQDTTAANEGFEERQLCDVCAQKLNLPHAPVPAKTMADIWKLLQLSAQQVRQSGKTLTCPDCNMTLTELRRRGRLGCPKDYEVFSDYLGELLERMHGATEHVGRIPGVGEVELERVRRISDLRQELGQAIDQEAYERAASLRDELKTLEFEGESAS